jgi:hypothetical protein
MIKKITCSLIFFFSSLSFFTAFSAELPPSFKKYYQLPPLKKLDKSKKHVFRVGFVENPNYTKLSRKEKIQLLKEIKTLCKKHLGYDLDTKLAWVKSTDQYYRKYQFVFNIPVFQQTFQYNLDYNSKDFRTEMEAVAKKLMKKHPDISDEYIKVKKHKEPHLNLMETFFKNFNAILNAKTDKGKPIYDKTRQYEHSFWHNIAILHELNDADFVFVNQVIALPEKTMPIYQHARGGLLTGFVDDNLHNHFRGAGLISLYPFFPRDKFFKKANGNIPDNLRISVAALYTIHELGHMINHRVEIYDHKGCVSKAATSLNYYKWYQDNNKDVCKRKHKHFVECF